MTKQRLDRWKEAKYLLTMLSELSGEDNDLSRLVPPSQAANDKAKVVTSGFTDFGIIEACKELIFDYKDDNSIFCMILYSFDIQTGRIKLENAMELSFDDEDSEEAVVKTLAIAAASDVPVYPNTIELAPILSRLHRRLLIEGFFAPSESGEKVRLKLKKSFGIDLNDPLSFKKIDLTESYFPADLALLQEAVTKELGRLKSVKLVLVSLDYSASELEYLLASEIRNENKLQKCLTENSILFGTDYKRIIPKHKLGAEFEMDYALERHSGLVDLVEIESSNLKLFNRSGNPTKDLVHAEQQVLDWFDWIETNGTYARNNLPGAFSPAGYIIIGRRESLSESDKNRLRRRNLLFRGQLEILTYEDLLDRAKNLSKHLQRLGDKKLEM